jgi:hypothetical protein
LDASTLLSLQSRERLPARIVSIFTADEDLQIKNMNADHELTLVRGNARFHVPLSMDHKPPDNIRQEM